MPRPRHGDFQSSGTSSSLEDSLSLVNKLTNLPPPLALSVQDLLQQSTSSAISKKIVIDSKIMEELCGNIVSDYFDMSVRSNDLLSARARLIKIKLLVSLTNFASVEKEGRSVLPTVIDTACNVLQKSVEMDASVRSEEVLATLRLLNIVIAAAGAKLAARLAEILGYLSVLSGLHHSGCVEGVKLIPTNLPHLHFTQCYASSNSDEQKPDSSCGDTTASEFSDTDIASDSDYKLKRIQVQVRKESLSCMAFLVKRSPKKDIVSYWYLFLPDKSFSPLQSSVPDLLSHSNNKIRQQALLIVSEFLNHSKQFLALAEHQDKATSYTSLSTALAQALELLHQKIFSCLDDLTGTTDQVALLKILALLTENCHYPRLSPPLLETLLSLCLAIARNDRNSVVQVAVMSVLSSLCQHCSSSSDVEASSEDILTCLLQRAALALNMADNNVRYMALQALANLASLDILVFLKHSAQVKRLIDGCLGDSDPAVILHAFRFIKSFTRNLGIVVEKQNNNSENQSQNITKLVVSFWVDFLKPTNFELLEKFPNSSIKSAFCDCLAEMGGTIYSELPSPKKIVCITFLLSQTRQNQDSSSSESFSQDRNVMSSSLRSLGIFVMFPCHLTDTAFHIDVAEAILPHLPPALPGIVKVKKKTDSKDAGNKTVRVSASWALANLTDTILQAERYQGGLEEHFPAHIAVRIVGSSVSASLDPSSAVNTKSNAVRCIGNMLYFLNQDQLEDKQLGLLMEEGTAALIHNISTGKIMKIRWNAAYAASTVLKKPSGSGGDSQYRRKLIQCLLDTVINSENFKVRINAALALGAVTERVVLGDQFHGILSGLLLSMERAYSLEVFGEYQHQAGLIDQLSLTACQLFALADRDDLTRSTSLIGQYWDILESSLKAAIRRVSPEKCGPFLEASKNLEILCSQGKTSEEMKMLLNLVKDSAQNFSI